MFKRILVPVDGSDTSKQALAAALQMANESRGRVRLVHLLDEVAWLTGYEYSVEVMDVARQQAQKILQEAMDSAKAAGVTSDSRLVEAPGQRLGDAIAEEAQAWEADLVVVGTHGRRGVARVLLGSGAEEVVRSAPVPVLAVRSSPAA